MSLTLIPDSAPFNLEQRAWLNGFLAGWLGIQESPDAPVAGSVTLSQAPIASQAPAEPAEEFPWHDPALPMTDRLKLADGRPFERRLMSAMAQLDCGACGYVCRTYSEAIASGDEPNLTLCSPGGSETAKALTRLVKERSTAPAPAPAPKVEAPPKPTTNGVAGSAWMTYSRRNPFTARVLRTVNLNAPGSEKRTHHVEIELGDSGPTYEVGDSLGLFPENCGELVEELIVELGAGGTEPVATSAGGTTPLREALSRHCCLSEVSEALLERLAEASAEAEQAEVLRRLIDDDEPITGFDVLDVLRRFPAARPSPADFIAALSEIRPRLYSISSSPKRHAGQVHLTVGRVAYTLNGRQRKGVASTMLADRTAPGETVRVFVQKAHGFTIPATPSTPMIMIGPGTGIAPFRAFLHERDAIGATGKNWLFFGDQRSSLDFLYRDELEDFLNRGLLTRLDTAFSRDQESKIYVQHRMLEHGRALFAWLEAGAHLYVCGDAKRMAADVDQALRQIVREHGGMTQETAASYIAALSSSGRYARDVY